MLHPVPAQHLIDEQERIRHDVELVGSFGNSQLHRFEESGILGDIVRGAPEVAAGFDDLAAIERQEGAVPSGTGIAARCAIDERGDLQDATFSP
jgi:hypothetical protein